MKKLLKALGYLTSALLFGAVLAVAQQASPPSTGRGVTTWIADQNLIQSIQTQITTIQQQLGTFLAFGTTIIPMGAAPTSTNNFLCVVNGVVTGCPGTSGGGGGFTSCSGIVQLINGVGTFSNPCVKQGRTTCLAQNTLSTHYSNPVTFPQPPVNGSITVTGTGNDTIQVTCPQ